MMDAIKEKRCFKCGELKPLSEFYKHKETKDGYLNKCKECAKKDTHNNYKKNIEYYKEYEHSEKRVKSRRKRSYRYTLNNRNKYPEKYKAHRMLANAIRKKQISKPNKCSKCGKECVPDGHHDDYSKPLDVVWLCRQCHRTLHNKIK